MLKNIFSPFTCFTVLELCIRLITFQVAHAVKTQLQKVQLQSQQLLQAQQQAQQTQILNGLMRQNAVYPTNGIKLRVKDLKIAI